MTNLVEIAPEIARLAKSRTRVTGSSAVAELACNIAQESILSLDPELEFLLDESAAFSQEDALVCLFGVCDLVVNGLRLDVRPADEEGRVYMSRALIGTSYLTGGTLVVGMQGSLSGSVVAYIAPSQWQTIDQLAGADETVSLKANISPSFDLAQTLRQVLDRQSESRVAHPAPAPEMFELALFLSNPRQLILSRQRQIVEGTLARPALWEQVGQVVSLWSRASMRQILCRGAAWNKTMEQLADALVPRFSRLGRQEIKAIIAKVGETYGGQPQSAGFRQALALAATREELCRALGGEVLSKAMRVAEAVLAGRSVAEAIKDFAGNRVAVDLAMAVKRQRNKVARFVEVSTEELSAAFQQVSLQPVYATHSQDAQTGIETINEVLKILEAGDLAQQIKELEEDLLNL